MNNYNYYIPELPNTSRTSKYISKLLNIFGSLGNIPNISGLYLPKYIRKFRDIGKCGSYSEVREILEIIFDWSRSYKEHRTVRNNRWFGSNMNLRKLE